MPVKRTPSRKYAAATKKKSSKKSTNPWIMLVNDVRRKHPNMSLKEAMVAAKPIYARSK